MSQNFVQQKHSKLNISAHGIGLNLKLNFPLQKLKNARKRIERAKKRFRKTLSMLSLILFALSSGEAVFLFGRLQISLVPHLPK